MARKRKGNKIDGWINFYKPAEMTSTQALGKVRWLLQAQKGGHGGTLDPLAHGVLPIALGEATKTVNFAQDHIKTYLFTVCWGEQRSTDDAEGEVVAASDKRPSAAEIEAILGDYIGDIEQTPPAYSAIKIDGQRAYDLARDGQTPDIKARTVYIEDLKLLEAERDTARFELVCGKGTYVRSLARDMGLRLGCYGYVSALERTQVGPFLAENAISLETLEKIDINSELDAVLLPLSFVLDDIPALELKPQEAVRLKNGQALSLISRPDFQRLADIGAERGKPLEALACLHGKPLALVDIDGPDVTSIRVFNL